MEGIEIKAMKNTDYEKFTRALYLYIKDQEKCTEEELEEKFATFFTVIKDLHCRDFRLYYFRAYYYNGRNLMDRAKAEIDESVELAEHLNRDGLFENSPMVFVPNFGDKKNGYFGLDYEPVHTQVSKVYFCAGEIYAKIGQEEESLKFYQRYQYYGSFLKSDFGKSSYLFAFSFRRFNEYTMADLVNNQITVSPSTKMNDPLDNIVNIWKNEEALSDMCREKHHVRPLSRSYDYFRLRSFCRGKGNSPVRNILMWSHYAGEHTGFCVKYRLSEHFISQDENDSYEHMYMKNIIYTNRKINVSVRSIDSTLAFATKKKDWKYENEMRLIVYNPNKNESHYGIDLGNTSWVDSIFFGYSRCPDSTIKTVRNVFANAAHSPKFYKMEIDRSNIYRLKYVRI